MKQSSLSTLPILISLLLSVYSCNVDSKHSTKEDKQAVICKTTLRETYNVKEITTTDLLQWKFYGKGKAVDEGHNQVLMAEENGSQGVMLVSPESYGKTVILSYDVMTLYPPTVLVAILSASNKGETNKLNIPAGYDGTMSLWINEVDNYFFAFNNASHNFPPFLRKYPKPGKEALVSADKNLMKAGVFYHINVGREDNKLWLAVDGKKILETEDKEALDEGHLALRIRGTGSERGACLIKNVRVYLPKEKN